ncbi:MAG: hypothetical protein Q8M40_11795 [Legionella sp.]|nr:hypothetical protein [Legionella sp.]
MSFIPPDFAILKSTTMNLESEYSRKLNRWKLNSSKSANSQVPGLANFQILVERINTFINNCDTDRKSQQDVIINLVNQLRDPQRENQDKVKANLYLMGALLHRYFRIIQSERTYGMGWFKTHDSKHSNLFKAIRIVLQLPFDYCNNNKKTRINNAAVSEWNGYGELNQKKFDALTIPADFKKLDLEVLDPVTIVQALKAFKELMFTKHNNIFLYTQFEHLNKDVNFQSNLDSIIIVHEPAAIPIEKNFKAIKFLRSLVIHLDIKLQIINEILQEWRLIWEKGDLDFNSVVLEKHIQDNVSIKLVSDEFMEKLKKSFPNEQLELHIQGIDLVSEMNSLMGMNYIHTLIDEIKDTENPSAALIDGLNCVFSSQLSHITAGAYSLLLSSKKNAGKESNNGTEMNDFEYCLYKALDISSAPQQLDLKYKSESLKLLKKLVQNNNIPLDVDFFTDNKYDLLSEITQVQKDLDYWLLFNTNNTNAFTEIRPSHVN